MSQAALDNLVRIGQLKAEPRNTTEAKRMLAMAGNALRSQNVTSNAQGGHKS
jgi:hypothetical protein